MTTPLTSSPHHPAAKAYPDLVVYGTGDMFKLISSASSVKSKFSKVTKAMYVEGAGGCVIQTTTRQGMQVSEGLVYYPGVKVIQNPRNTEGTCKYILVPIL